MEVKEFKESIVNVLMNGLGIGANWDDLEDNLSKHWLLDTWEYLRLVF